MPIRITNSIMNNNTKSNINLNKVNKDSWNTKIATGQKITRPSDDPVIAIRALRMNANIAQANQYYDRNIPDAEAWLKITETALAQTDTVLARIQESMTAGASDDNTAEDRMNILADLKSMRDQIYSAGNADYADRTVFTGYRTSLPLTFTEAETNHYSIKEELSQSSIEKMTYISGDFDVDKTGSDLGTAKTEQGIVDNEIYRIRLAYDGLQYPQSGLYDGGTHSGTDVQLSYKVGGTATSVNLTVVENANDAAYVPPTTGATLIAETGEIILSEDLRSTLLASNVSDISVEYAKEKWNKNDLRPEHYFQCTDKDEIDYNRFEPDGTVIPKFQNQEITYEISFNQSITINTSADKVFTHDICRDVDELMQVTQSVLDADQKLSDLKAMLEDTAINSDPAKVEEINNRIAAMTKERDLRADLMQKKFSEGLTKFREYADRNNLALTNVGAVRKRVELTKERVNEQLNSFGELADANININLADAAIDLSNAKLALEAAQLAAGKMANQTLLNYI